MPDDLGWQAHIVEGPNEWMSRTVRLILVERHRDGGGRQVVGFDDGGHPVCEDVLPGVVLRPGFRIPREALPSLRDSIEPGPSAAEVRRLEEALAVERTRVDRALERVPGAVSVARMGLDEVLRRAGDEWGPLGVALAAARLTDRGALVRRLTEGKAAPVDV